MHRNRNIRTQIKSHTLNCHNTFSIEIHAPPVHKHRNRNMQTNCWTVPSVLFLCALHNTLGLIDSHKRVCLLKCTELTSFTGKHPALFVLIILRQTIDRKVQNWFHIWRVGVRWGTGKWRMKHNFTSGMLLKTFNQFLETWDCSARGRSDHQQHQSVLHKPKGPLVGHHICYCHMSICVSSFGLCFFTTASSDAAVVLIWFLGYMLHLFFFILLLLSDLLPEKTKFKQIDIWRILEDLVFVYLTPHIFLTSVFLYFG